MTSNPVGFSKQGDENLHCVIFKQKVLFPRVKIFGI